MGFGVEGCSSPNFSEGIFSSYFLRIGQLMKWLGFEGSHKI